MPAHEMPSDLRAVYEALRTEVTWLHARWISYTQLFGKSPKRIDLLNECARSLFYFVHETLANDLLLSLCKLTDPATQGKNENLSLHQLQQKLDSVGEPSLAAGCKTVLATLDGHAEPLKTLRNKQLAHLDLAVALNKATEPLPPVSRQEINEALALVRQYLNAIEIYYNDNEWGYEHFLMTGSDGDALVHVLSNGLRYHELVLEEVIEYDDFQKGAWNDA